MFAYSYNPAQWQLMTDGLDVEDEGILHRLVDWMMLHDALLPLDFEQCCEIARLTPIARRHAVVTVSSRRDYVVTVLERYFVGTPIGYALKETSKAVPNPGDIVPKKMAQRASARARQRATRDRKTQLIRQAKEAGLHAVARMGIGELEILMSSHVVTTSSQRDDVSPEMGQSNGHALEEMSEMSSRCDDRVTSVTGGVAREYNTLIKNTEYINTFNTEIQLVPSALAVRAREAVTTSPFSDIETPPPPPSRRGLAGLALKRGGLHGVNLSDPRLDALLASGVTDDELQMAATEASARGKGWGYCLGIVRSRREEAGRLQAALANGAAPPESLAARVAQWAPSLATYGTIPESGSIDPSAPMVDGPAD